MLDFVFDLKKESKWMYASRLVDSFDKNYSIGNNYIDLDELLQKIVSEEMLFIFLKELSFRHEKLLLKRNSNSNEIIVYSSTKQFDDIVKILNQIKNCRDQQDMPQNYLSTDELITWIKKNFKSSDIEILGEKEIKLNKLNLIDAIGKSSKNKPYVAIIKHIENPTLPNALVIGKGVMYDAGGYNLKLGKNLLGMKADMSGAGTVINLMKLLENKTINKNVIAVVPIVENLLAPNALQPQEVITSYDGTTVEILNTDAEGRLILADALSYGIDKYKPSHAITVATLAGSVTQFLDNFATALFGSDESRIESFLDATKNSGERIYFAERFLEVNKRLYKSSTIADIANIDSNEKMGPHYAFEFLNHFAGNTPLLHLDIAGTAVVNRDRGTGIMIKTLYDYFTK